LNPDAEQKPTPRKDWHALTVEDVLAAVRSDPAHGLSDDDAARRLAQHGPNALPEAKPRPLVKVFLGQFASPLIYLLLVAAALAFALGHLSDAVVIVVVVLVNAVVGTLQEGRAERSLALLRHLEEHPAGVLRAGQERRVEARDLVPGDILVLTAGDAVAADARLIFAATTQVAEAALTGESLPVTKDLDALPGNTLLADRRNMLYAGTHVTSGRARAVVVATGLDTELGVISALTSAAKVPPTPLERRIAQFGRYVIVGAGVLFVAVNAVGLLRGMPFAEILMVAISQLVGMVPEGLPVAMTVALAVGVQRMARRKAIVRRLSAVETLGSTTIICTDKTGTLTRNEMTVTALVLPDGREMTVEGAGYLPDGRILGADGAPLPSPDPALLQLLESGVLCNDAHLQRSDTPGTGPKPIGDPTEVALLVLALKAGIDPEELRGRVPRRGEVPFDSALKFMATRHEFPAGPSVVVKGAPEVVLPLCTANPDEPLRTAEGLAGRALRVLALASAPDTELAPATAADALRGRCTLLGLVGEIDPPRPEAADAVRLCREAGIRPIMVTGDHKVTGRAIALQLGIASEQDLAVDGRELEAMDDAALRERLPQISVFARVHPAQKLRIVEAYQARGDVVAMTGDGVNDAPALMRADVGVAMGIAGTEVAKEAAKIVIADDNFATIVAAVEEGRVVYRNIKKAILLLFTTSLAEVIVLLAALVLGYPPPFAAVQILWNNLVTEGVITVNLIMEPAEGDEMRRPPLPPGEPLLTRPLLFRMLLMTPAIVVSTLGWFTWRLSSGVPLLQAQAETFTLLAVCEWFNVLNCRSETRSALQLSLWRNPWLMGGLIVGNLLQVAVVYWAPLGRLFHTVPIPWPSVAAIGVVGSLVLWVEEARKLVARRRLARAR
jgi:magnesium-transporting ATPase (P-type)